MTTPLTALSPLDGRYARQTAPLAGIFSELGLIRERVRVEVAYLLALLAATAHPANTPDTRAALASLADDFSPADAEAVKTIEAETRHDVKAVEYWLKDRLLRLPALAPHAELVHLGLTSEDVNNLAYARMQQMALRVVLLPAYAELLAALTKLADETRALPMLARTHGQPASPTTLGKELGVFVDRLVGTLAPLPTFRLPGKLNGATGTYAALAIAYPQVDWLGFSEHVLAQLDLAPSLVTTQIEPHDGYAALYDGLRRVNNVLLDLAQDAWRYVSDGYFQQRAVAGEVGSSAMPHKVNPIDFENAEGNLGLANALFVFFADKLTKSRLQRDLSDSTVLRNLGVAFGHTLVAVQNLLRGLDRIAPDAARMRVELEAHPEVIAEAIQTVLRAEGQTAPYEALKALTRGRRVTLDELRAEATRLCPGREATWRDLSPETYVGLAPQLADLAVLRARAWLAER